MLDDEIGMHVDDVKKHLYVIESKLSKEDKLYNSLLELQSDAKEAYKSRNGNVIDVHNANISESVNIKKANLKSYKKYIEKMVVSYTNTTNKAIDSINEMKRKLDKKIFTNKKI